MFRALTRSQEVAAIPQMVSCFPLRLRSCRVPTDQDSVGIRPGQGKLGMHRIQMYQIPPGPDLAGFLIMSRSWIFILSAAF